jgi:hypothetical protein
MLRKLIALLMLLAVLASPASGFDTFWHSEATRKVAEANGFSEDARKIMQLGNFSPDFFGPVSDFAASNLHGKGLDALNQYVAKNVQDRDAAVFFHFDNLSGELVRNAQFDYLFNRLLTNTQWVLGGYIKQTNADERTRKVMTLIVLGASLHVIQDFYSHSDWIHNDFNHTAVKLISLPGGGYRAPTWFEFRNQADDPDKWPFQVKTGIYPPVAGALNTHTHMNHDNSRLIYREYETQGQPLVSQAKYHNVGPVPANEQDPASSLAHQQLAYNTAVAASIEWVKMVEQYAVAKAAIESAKSWQLKIKDPKLARELEAGQITEMALSCAAGKWDGEDPPGDRGVLCRTVLDRTISPSSATSAANIASILEGLAADAVFPYALKYTGKFWDVHKQYHLLDHLAEGIGVAGHYTQKK